MTVKLEKCNLGAGCWSERKRMGFMRGKVFKIFGTKTFIDPDSESHLTTKVATLAQFTMTKKINK